MKLGLGLRGRMVAAFAAVALLSSVAASGVAYLLVRRAILERAQDAALAEFKGTLSRMVPARMPPERTTLAREIEEELASRPGRRAYVMELPAPPGVSPGDRIGLPVSRTFERRARSGTVFQRVVRGGDPYLLVGTRQGRIVAYYAVGLRREDADLRSFASAMVIADVLALGPALLLALLAARGVLRPVRRLGGAARALGAGRLDVRVPVRGADELADLATTFNETAGALERTVAELRTLEAASRRFVADVSHELRTPLTTMVAATDVLAEEAAGSPDGDTAAGLVVEETRRLRRLVEHLIEISRFDAKAAALVPDDGVISAAVAASLAARGWTDRVSVDGPAALRARLDPRRFDVIVANLVGNAIEHGRPPVELRFRHAERDGRAGFALSVPDGGPGIPDELLEGVFDRFVKADAARGGGSGLGLPIARANATLHGGDLTAANRPAGGAEFTLWLPTDQDQP